MRSDIFTIVHAVHVSSAGTGLHFSYSMHATCPAHLTLLDLATLVTLMKHTSCGAHYY